MYIQNSDAKDMNNCGNLSCFLLEAKNSQFTYLYLSPFVISIFAYFVLLLLFTAQAYCVLLFHYLHTLKSNSNKNRNSNNKK